MNAIIPLNLTEIDGEPRCRDLDIAERLGFSRPRDIRKIIERHLPEIEGFGPSRHVGAMVDIGSGAQRHVAEYWLNEEQALLVAVLSNAPKAPEVRAMLIRTFTAWRRQQDNQLPPPWAAALARQIAYEVVTATSATPAGKKARQALRPPADVIGISDHANRVVQIIREAGGECMLSQLYRRMVNRVTAFQLREILDELAARHVIVEFAKRQRHGPRARWFRLSEALD